MGPRCSRFSTTWIHSDGYVWTQGCVWTCGSCTQHTEWTHTSVL